MTRHPINYQDLTTAILINQLHIGDAQNPLGQGDFGHLQKILMVER